MEAEGKVENRLSDIWITGCD